MSNEERTRKPYPTDLTDEQWAIVEPMIPPPRTQHGGTPRRVDMREVINTLLHQNRTGCQWELLPHDLFPRARFTSTLPSGGMTEPGPGGSTRCESVCGVKQDASPPPVRLASTANRSR